MIMKNKLDIPGFIDVLHKTHTAEWEATPSNQEAIRWLNDLIEFLFPDNHLNKRSTYEGRLKKKPDRPGKYFVELPGSRCC